MRSLALAAEMLRELTGRRIAHASRWGDHEWDVMRVRAEAGQEHRHVERGTGNGSLPANALGEVSPSVEDP